MVKLHPKIMANQNYQCALSAAVHGDLDQEFQSPVCLGQNGRCFFLSVQLSASVIGQRPNFTIAYFSALDDCEKCPFWSYSDLNATSKGLYHILEMVDHRSLVLRISRGTEKSLWCHHKCPRKVVCRGDSMLQGILQIRTRLSGNSES